MHGFYHRRIATEPAWIEVLHLAGELFNILRGLGIGLNHLLKFLELAEALFDGALRVGGIAGGVCRRGLLITP